ncbi:hypothetical protein Poli38472_009384 [Pythium oligandrum]|uniref:Uncharacterized protein n=1 Tax=Pythium oligandrum TaxID=41045 RepID=A0A8K1CMR9_PYTOL|nr:hypothetical protein Poli38472_009384 [Pythium oligandrum]|eukprot:TMW65217.1 hypothetical protein Poli38472_009384 [Pythium oligandrum]
MSTAISSSSKTSGSGSDTAGVAPPRRSVPIAPDTTANLTILEGTCAHYAQGPDGCALPRTCADCLLKKGCMIDRYGTCVSQEGFPFNSTMDFRIAQDRGLVYPNASDPSAVNIQSWEFPALSAGYCASSDPICRSCREARYWLPSFSADSRYCIGLSGCICIANCEINWNTYNSAVCITPNGSDNQNNNGSSSSSASGNGFFIWISAGILVVGMVCYWTFRQSSRFFRTEMIRRDVMMERHRRLAHEARLQSRISNMLGIQPLSLSGWMKHRQDLADKEKAELEGAVSPTTPTTTSTAFVSIEEASHDVVVVANESAARQHYYGE